ncbi:MAG TPA: MMPL family transporter [Gaiellaceae bacterium]|nr:MMPL family transporter [Gaiellaceae bacterium]
MQSQTSSRNVAARMGRWSATHRKLAIFGWLAFVAVAFVFGGMIGTKNIDYKTSGPGESGRADRILAEDFQRPAEEIVLLQSASLTTSDPAFAAVIEDVVQGLGELGSVTNVRSPLDPDNSGHLAPSGHAALVTFDISGDADDAEGKIDPIVDRVAELQKAHPDVYIGQFGDTSANKALNESFGKDMEKAGLFSLPITLVILVVAFGALVAAGIPLLLGLTAVLATLGLIALPSQVLPVHEAVPAIVLLIGLAVGVDYSMFYLKREREERAAGKSEEAALEAAAATSGRSVLISGLTVMVAMGGMLLTGDPSFASMGIATMLVVAIAMLGSLTVLPALLSKLGDNVDRLHVPFVGRLRRDDGQGRIWGGIVDRVLKRPVLSVAVAGGLLLALAVPALQLHTAQPGPESFPQELPVMQTFNRLQNAFPGKEIPANVVVKADDVTAPEVQAAIGELRKRAVATGRMHEPITVDVNDAGTVASIAVPMDGKGTDDASNAALASLRGEVVPETVGALDGVETAVTGMAASSKDGNDQLKATAPLVFGFVLVFAFVLMLAAFRSVAIAVKAIVLNLLSVAAAYGVLVLVFQHGIGKGLLGFETTSGIVPFLPVFLFVILFGLSMDYHVFILSRIRELYDGGASTDEAISQGIRSTAGVVTSAAIVMVGVFAIFGTLSMIVFKQFGVGLAAAVLIDATIVRAVLLPATMKLLGEWNWWFPQWLGWLPSLGHERKPESPALESA